MLRPAVLHALTNPRSNIISTSHRSRGGMADAYGSGPYGETRGGSTPLVSTFPADYKGVGLPPPNIFEIPSQTRAAIPAKSAILAAMLMAMTVYSKRSSLWP